MDKQPSPAQLLRQALDPVTAASPEARVLAKAHARIAAREAGKPVPKYKKDELRELYRQDKDMVSGEAKMWRSSPGWQGAEDQALVDAWETDARRRLERIEEGETLEEVYEEHDLDMEDEDDG